MKLKKSPGVILLMGCSSGKLRSAGDFEPIGMALSYILSGSPAVVGNLWDVTDADIDRYCIELLDSWIDKDPEQALPVIVSKSRKVCKMKHIIGAAPVCYGLPVYLHYSSDGRISTSHTQKVTSAVEAKLEVVEEVPETPRKKSIPKKRITKSATAAKEPQTATKRVTRSTTRRA